MKRGILQSFPVKQIMAADNTNWWIVNNTTDHPLDDPLPSSSLLPPYHLPHNQQLQNSPSSSTSNSSSVPLHAAWPCYQVPEQFPDSWSQLLMGGFVGEEEIGNFDQIQAKKMVNWEDSLHQSVGSSSNNVSLADVKHEIFGCRYPSEDFKPNSLIKQTWSSSSPSSCVTNFFNGSHNNMMEFASSSNNVDRTSDCCSNTTGGVTKKARLQHSGSQPAFKARKEKLGDRINALHQLVSPFGKTDTASVLLEAIGYIRFLQNQIEALSLPYMGNKSKPQQCFNEGARSLFSDEPDHQDGKEKKRDLTSRGLCLVPVSCTLQGGSDNSADYWAPAFGGRFR